MVCEMGKIIVRNGLLHECSEPVQIMIGKHEAEDQARIARESANKRREEIRQEAMSKLTSDEIAALGLLRK